MSTFETFKWSYRQTLAMEKTDKEQEKDNKICQKVPIFKRVLEIIE